ncbi:MAG: hypothetical protein IJN80_03260 [Clostridia bacterium]|nr:hypothetical protein [Clostridia bacterium]
MNYEPKDQESIFDEIMSKIESIQQDHIIEKSQKIIDEHEQSSIVDEAIFDEIKNSPHEFKSSKPKSPIRKIFDEEEDENTAEEEQPIHAAAIYEEPLDDIEDYESEDERDEIYRDLKNTVGKMAAKSIILFLIAVISLYLFIAGFKPALFGNNVDTVWFQIIHLALDGVCFFFSFSIFTQGLLRLLRVKADTDTMLALLCISLIIVRVVNLISPDLLPYSLNLEPMLTVGLYFNVISKKKIAANIKRNFKHSASGGDKLTLSMPISCETNNNLILETGEGGDVVYAHRTGLISRFIDHSYSDYDWDQGIQRFLFGTLLFIIAGFIALIQLVGWGEAILFPAASLAVSLPFFARYFYANSIWKVGKKVRKRGGVLTSAKSAHKLKDAELLIVSEEELLGEDAVLLQGVKAIGDMQIDRLITNLAALFSHENTPLRTLFLKMIDSNSVSLPRVDDIYYHEGMGYTCLIDSKMFLVGNAEFMKNFNIEFPKSLMELNLSGCKFPVYVAYHKSPVGVFIVGYESNKHTMDGLLYAEEKNLGIGVVSRDFNFGPELLKELYPMVHVDSFVHFITKKTGEECMEQLVPKAKSADLVSSRNGFKGLVASLLGAKKLLSALKTNLFIRILYAILSMALIFFIALSGYSANTALQILAFQGIWMVPVCAICIFCK